VDHPVIAVVAGMKVDVVDNVRVVVEKKARGVTGNEAVVAVEAHVGVKRPHQSLPHGKTVLREQKKLAVKRLLPKRPDVRDDHVAKKPPVREPSDHAPPKHASRSRTTMISARDWMKNSSPNKMNGKPAPSKRPRHPSRRKTTMTSAAG